MMNNLELTSELRIFVFQHVIAVWTGDHDLFDPIAFKSLDVLHRLELEQVLVAHAPCWIAAAGLLLAKDAEVDAGSLQYLAKGSRHLHVPFLECSGAADVVQNLDIAILGHDLGTLDAGAPIEPAGSRTFAGMSTLLDAPQRHLSRLWHLSLLQYQVSTHIDNLINVFNEHRTGFHAGAAGSAVPDNFRRYHAAYHGNFSLFTGAIDFLPRFRHLVHNRGDSYECDLI